MGEEITLTPFEVSAMNAYNMAISMHNGYVMQNLLQLAERLEEAADEANSNGDKEKSEFYLETKSAIFGSIFGYVAEA